MVNRTQETKHDKDHHKDPSRVACLSSLGNHHLRICFLKTNDNRKMKLFFFGILLCYFWPYTESRSIPVTDSIRSDVVVTKFGPDVDYADENKPGWMRRTLIRFGQVASDVGNSLGKHTVKVTNAIDKICDIVKTVIPLLSAVCSVGQFKFCSATESAPGDIQSALAPNPMDLNIPD